MSEFKYVPVEPTEEMICAALNEVSELFTDELVQAYKSMITAAPTQPSPAEPDRDAMLKYYSDHAKVICNEVTQYQKRIRELESDKESVRNAALEEAAKECDIIDGDCSECPEMAQYCGEAIRALKSQLDQPSEPSSDIPWDNFPGYLIDHHEGDVITEELLQFALAGMLKDSSLIEQAQPSDSRTEFSDTELLRDAITAILWLDRRVPQVYKDMSHILDTVARLESAMRAQEGS